MIGHTGEKPFKCDITGLNDHSRTHSGETPYKCNICDKSFTGSHHFNRHMTIHNGNKLHKCEL